MAAKPAPHAMRNAYLIGAKVYLRPLEEADAARSTDWLNDPEVRRGLGQSRLTPQTEEGIRDRARKRDFASHPAFAIVKRADGDHIGDCSLRLDGVDRRASLGIMVGRKDLWSKGFGTEAAALLCRHGFENLNLHKICLTVYANNERAIRVYAKLGFKPEGRLREQAFIEGRYVDEIVMGLLRGELEAR
jgi:RimJ/RimL family protein N-acetyltransferase